MEEEWRTLDDFVHHVALTEAKCHISNYIIILAMYLCIRPLLLSLLLLETIPESRARHFPLAAVLALAVPTDFISSTSSA